MLRCTRVALRIGTHVDPSYAGFGLEYSVPLKVVGSPDLESEAGFRSSKREASQRKADAASAFRQRREDVVRKVKGDGVATVANAELLFSHGSVDTGVSMLEFIEKRRKGGIPTPALPRLIHALSAPVQLAHYYSIEGNNMPEAYKQLGSFRGHERAREAEFLNDILHARLAKTDAPSTTRNQLAAAGFNGLLDVYCTGGYDACLQVPDRLYDKMFFDGVQPTMATYRAVIRALGLTTRMAECEAVWAWLKDTQGERLNLSLFATVLDAYCEAERHRDVELLFDELILRGRPRPDAACFDTLIRSIHGHSRHYGGAIPAAVEKSLIFVPTMLRRCGVASCDIHPDNLALVDAAVERWTYRRGLDKTYKHVIEEREREYNAWNEGQRWKHIGEDEVNTSMIEAAVRRFRGDGINERMRLDVQKGGGRGVIYPPQAVRSVTRYDNVGQEERRLVLWDKIGVASSMHGKRAPVATEEETARKLQFARKAAVSERRGGGSSGVWKR
ncbi:hypothetical protein DIPPA_33653 [Diplonema papillatum]|nr:hypothetical protein DIPPA_33653 [Diplonema papillatum]